MSTPCPQDDAGADRRDGYPGGRRRGRAVDATPVAIAVLRLCGYRSYTAVAGDAAAAEAVREMRRAVRHAAEAHGVRVQRCADADVVLAVDDRATLLACVDRCLEHVGTVGPMVLRAGVASGPCVRLEDGELLGATINRAAYLCERAPGNQVAVDGEHAPQPPQRTIFGLLH